MTVLWMMGGVTAKFHPVICLPLVLVAYILRTTPLLEKAHEDLAYLIINGEVSPGGEECGQHCVPPKSM